MVDSAEEDLGCAAGEETDAEEGVKETMQDTTNRRRKNLSLILSFLLRLFH